MPSDARVQTRLSLAPDIARDLAKAKAEAEAASGMTFTDAQFILGLLRAELARRKEKDRN